MYGASKSEFSTIQSFLDRCRQRKYISRSIYVHELLEKQERIVFNLDLPSPRNLITEKKGTKYNVFETNLAIAPKVMRSYVKKRKFVIMM